MAGEYTSIDLPYAVEEEVGYILEEAGFEQGSIGSGVAQWTRDGVIGKEERVELVRKLAEEFFVFEAADEDGLEVELPE